MEVTECEVKFKRMVSPPGYQNMEEAVTLKAVASTIATGDPTSSAVREIRDDVEPADLLSLASAITLEQLRRNMQEMFSAGGVTEWEFNRLMRQLGAPTSDLAEEQQWGEDLLRAQESAEDEEPGEAEED